MSDRSSSRDSRSQTGEGKRVSRRKRSRQLNFDDLTELLGPRIRTSIESYSVPIAATITLLCLFVLPWLLRRCLRVFFSSSSSSSSGEKQGRSLKAMTTKLSDPTPRKTPSSPRSNAAEHAASSKSASVKTETAEVDKIDVDTSQFLEPSDDVVDRSSLQQDGHLSMTTWKQFFEAARARFTDQRTLNTLEAVYAVEQKNEDVQLVIATMIHEVFESCKVDGDFGLEKLAEVTQEGRSRAGVGLTKPTAPRCVNIDLMRMQDEFSSNIMRLGQSLRRRRGV